MSSRAADNYLKAATAESLGHNRIRAGAIENEAVVDRIAQARCGKNVAHAAQVTFPLFAYVADKQEWESVPDVNCA